MTNFEKFKKLCQDHGLTLRTCTSWHWQITGADGVPLVNVWPTSGKYGKAIEQFEYVKDIPMKASKGTVGDAVKMALKIILNKNGIELLDNKGEVI